MEIRYSDFIEKLKPRYKRDLKGHPYKEYLQAIVSTLFRYHEEYLEEDNVSLNQQSQNYVNYMYYIRDLENGQYVDAYNFLSCEPMTGAFDYAIIKKSEEVLFDD